MRAVGDSCGGLRRMSRLVALAAANSEPQSDYEEDEN